ncbi:unnamed protein product [Lymnaea stagnalis]|uniref:Uncharacterized protein n=1 Tax=Lymnaea stagnalis TaxID=6523 RepID=A0AAV2HVT3_LYMST
MAEPVWIGVGEKANANQDFDNKRLKEKGKECEKDKYYVPVNSDDLKEMLKPVRSNMHLHDLILKMVKLTGLISVTFKDLLIPGEGTGTGFIQRIRRVLGRCPCPECKDHTNTRRYAILSVATALHVLHEDPESCKSTIDVKFIRETVKMILDYDDKTKDPEKCPSLYGYRISDTDKDIDVNSDWCCIEFVSHKMDLVSDLEKTLTEFQDLQKTVYNYFKQDHKYKGHVIIIGHPHGLQKQLSFSKTMAERKPLKEVRDTQRWCRYKYDATTCQGFS